MPKRWRRGRKSHHLGQPEAQRATDGVRATQAPWVEDRARSQMLIRTTDVYTCVDWPLGATPPSTTPAVASHNQPQTGWVGRRYRAPRRPRCRVLQTDSAALGRPGRTVTGRARPTIASMLRGPVPSRSRASPKQDFATGRARAQSAPLVSVPIVIGDDSESAWRHEWAFRIGTFSPSFWSEVVQMQLVSRL